MAEQSAESVHGGKLAHHRLVLRRHPHRIRRLLDDGQKCREQIRLRCPAEKLRRRVVGPGQNSLRVGNGHLLDGVAKNPGSHWDGLFGGMVHRGDKIVRHLALTGQPQRALHLLQFIRHRDFHIQVGEESAVMAKRDDSVGHALAQGFLQTARHLVRRQGRNGSRGRRVGRGQSRFQLIEQTGVGGETNARQGNAEWGELEWSFHGNE